MNEIKSAYPTTRYIIAITPRSGSSFLCDMIKKTGVLGMPEEFLSDKGISLQLQKAIPGNTPDQYLGNILKVYKTDNAVAGIKATWLQFKRFYSTLQNPVVVQDFKYIYLTRPDLALQAVSLYKGAESRVFNSVTNYPAEAVQKLENLDYDFEKIDYWYQHILEHEHGWQEFFSANCISPLVINYHDICCDWQAVVKKIARFMELPNSAVEVVEKTTPILNSPFKKIGDERNALWAERFCLEKMHKGERIRSSLCSTDLSSPKTKKDWSALNSYQE